MKPNKAEGQVGRAPTQGPIKERGPRSKNRPRRKTFGGNRRCFFLACLPLVPVCVCCLCLSSCLGLGAVRAVLVWCLPRPLPGLLLFSRGLRLHVGAVPKTSKDILGISLAASSVPVLGSTWVTWELRMTPIIVDPSPLSTLRRLVSPCCRGSRVSSSLSSSGR